jgi:hypothetical protein
VANFIPIAGYERFFLGSCPAFDPALERERFLTGRCVGAPDKLNRAATASPIAAYALLVLPNPAFKVVRMACVVGAVSAAK